MVLKPNIYVLYQKMERLDSILKSVVTSSTVVSVESSPSTLPGDTNLVIAKPEPEEPREETQVQAQVQAQVQPLPALEEVQMKPKSGGRRTLSSSGAPVEDDRKIQRRERNKQAAARCRKRRMDLTCSLQVTRSMQHHAAACSDRVCAGRGGAVGGQGKVFKRGTLPTGVTEERVGSYS